VPGFASAIARLRDLDDYDDAELAPKKIEACFTAFVTGDDAGLRVASKTPMLRGFRC
jgi:capsid protein